MHDASTSKEGSTPGSSIKSLKLNQKTFFFFTSLQQFVQNWRKFLRVCKTYNLKGQIIVLWTAV